MERTAATEHRQAQYVTAHRLNIECWMGLCVRSIQSIGHPFTFSSVFCNEKTIDVHLLIIVLNNSCLNCSFLCFYVLQRLQMKEALPLELCTDAKCVT